MEERKYEINWLGLFIKVIIFVVVVLLAIWLVSKIIRRDKGLSFEENNKLFKEASVEYFSKNLPEAGETSTVTLKQLISWDYLNKLKNEKGKACDTKNSKSKIELIDNYYSIKTELICGENRGTTYIKFGNQECTNCDVKIEGLEIKKEEQTETKEENKTSEPETTTPTSKKDPDYVEQDTRKGSETTQPTNQIVLYEYIKEVDEYSDWYTGKVTGKNIENSTKKVSYSKFCKKTNLNNCITDKTANASNYSGYKKVSTWNENIDIYRYKITVTEYKYSNAESLEGYTKTGKTKIADQK